MDESAARALSSLQQQHNLPESFMKRMEEVVMRHRRDDDEEETPSTMGETSDTTDTLADQSRIDVDASSEDTPARRGAGGAWAGLKNLEKMMGMHGDAAAKVGMRARLAEAQRENIELGTRVEVMEEQLKQAVARCGGLKDELAQLRRERSAVENAYRIREGQMKQLSDKTAEKLGVLETEARTFRANIKDAVYHRLIIGDEAAAMLRAKRPDTLDLVEFIQLTVADRLQQFYKKRDEEEADVGKLLRELQGARAESDRVKQLYEDASSELEAVKGDGTRRAQRYEERIAQLASEVEHLHAQLDKDREVSRSAHRIADDLADKTKMVASLEAERLTLATRLESAEKELAALKGSLSTDQQQQRQTATEVMYLTKENEALLKRTKGLEDEKHDLATQVRTLQAQLQENLDKYTKELVAAEERMSSRLRDELDKFEAMSSQEIARIREHTKALADREYGQLRTEKELALQEVTRSTQRARELESELKQLKLEVRMQEDRARSEVAGLRADLRVKITEASQLQIAKEQSDETNARLEVEAACAGKKLDALKAEFYELQVQHSRRVGEMEARLAGVNEQLKIYRDLEAECDDAIENTGRLLTGTDDSAASAAAVLAQGVPSSSNRRIQQSLVLAKRAMNLENQLAVAKQELQRCAAQKDDADAKLTRLRSIMEEKGQPYRYFIDTLAARDEEIKSVRGDLQRVKAELEVESQDKLKLKDVVDAMQGQMTALKDQRDELSAYLQQQLQGTLAEEERGRRPSQHRQRGGTRRTTRGRSEKARRGTTAGEAMYTTEGHSSNTTNPPDVDAGRVAIQPPLALPMGAATPCPVAASSAESEGGVPLFEQPLVISA